MTFRFLHSSDLHLGKPFGGFPEGPRGRLREARYQVIGRLTQVARDHGAGVVLLAGDTFDAETPAPDTLRQALRAMADSGLHWILLPGNHDSLAATQLWRQIVAAGLANIHPVLTEAAFEIAPGVQLLPSPCTARKPGRDLTEAMTQPTPSGALRIGLGHGAITDFSGEEGGAGIIPPDRAQRSGLDYLALGDWHGQLSVGPRTMYAGTPEPDGFKHAGRAASALVVTVAAGAVPVIAPVPTEGLHWRAMGVNLLPGLDAVAELRARLPTEGVLRDTFLAVAATGRVTQPDRLALDAALAAIAPDYGWFQADCSGLAVDTRPDDLDLIDHAGALRRAAEALLAEADDPALAAQDRAAAAAALSRLFQFAAEDAA